MATMLIFGLGYTARRLADAAARARLAGDGDAPRRRRRACWRSTMPTACALRSAAATHILSSVPPDADGADPVLARYGASARAAGALARLSLLDRRLWRCRRRLGRRKRADRRRPPRGARRRPMRPGRRCGEARVFRLPGIYGPGRSRARAGARRAARTASICRDRYSAASMSTTSSSAVIASFDGPPGVYNIADDVPASQNAVIEEACRAARRLPRRRLRSLDRAGLSPMARGFYAENRRVANGKAKRLLGWRAALRRLSRRPRRLPRPWQRDEPARPATAAPHRPTAVSDQR